MVQGAQLESKAELAKFKEAQNKEFDDYKAQKDKEADLLQVYADQAGTELDEIKADYDKNRDVVAEMLLDSIMNVKLELPKVVIGNFEGTLEA